jgi:hypothetical protein
MRGKPSKFTARGTAENWQHVAYVVATRGAAKALTPCHQNTNGERESPPRFLVLANQPLQAETVIQRCTNSVEIVILHVCSTRVGDGTIS